MTSKTVSTQTNKFILISPDDNNKCFNNFIESTEHVKIKTSTMKILQKNKQQIQTQNKKIISQQTQIKDIFEKLESMEETLKNEQIIKQSLMKEIESLKKQLNKNKNK